MDILCSSSGGHFVQLKRISESLNYEHCLVSTNSNSYDKLKYKLVTVDRQVILFLYNFIYSVYIILKERPQYIISTGAGDTLSLLIVGRLMGSKVIYIESISRRTSHSATGKILIKLHIPNKHIVQWKELEDKEKNIEYWGCVL